MAPTRRTPPPPLEGNDRLITQAITAGWAVTLIVLLIVRGSLPADERWWVWTAVTGLAMGVLGLWYVPYLQRRRAVMAARRASERAQDSPENDSNTVSSSETPGSSTRS